MVTSVNKKVDRERKQAICLEYLKLAARDIDTARVQRTVYIQRARELGISNVAIGEALGITEARVRQIARAA